MLIVISSETAGPGKTKECNFGSSIMNTGILILIILAAGALIIFLVLQNRKDRRKFTDQLNRDYRHSKEEEGDIDIDEIKK